MPGVFWCNRMQYYCILHIKDTATIFMPKEYRPLLWTGTITLGVLAIYLLVLANHTLNTAATTNTISFSGEGKVVAKPDIAIVNFSIVTEATHAKEAQENNSSRSNVVVSFLENQNIEEKDIKTTSYNIQPKYTYPRGQEPKIVGYRVEQTIQVKIRDLENIDTVLDGAVSAGVNKIQNLRLTIDDEEQLRTDARKEAIDDAKAKAQKLKRQLDIDLGKIVNFSESGGPFPPPIWRSLEADGIGMGGGGPSIPTGENEITVNVTITWQIR